MFTPFRLTGAVMVSHSDMPVEALVRIARRDERVRAILLAILTYSSFGQIAMFAGLLAIASQVDLYIATEGQRGIDPNSRRAMLIRQEIQDVYGGPQQPEPAVAGPGTAPPPPWVNGASVNTGGGPVPSESAPPSRIPE